MYTQFITFEMALKSANIKARYHQLGYQIELRPLTLTDSTGNLFDNHNIYGQLYKNGVKLSDEVFRIGGLGGKFNDELYCMVLNYKWASSNKVKSEQDLFDSGNWVLINDQGQIVYTSPKQYANEYYLGGNILIRNSDLISVLTGEVIGYSATNYINGRTNIILNHQLSYNKNDNLPVGIYSINKLTCELTKLDDIHSRY